MQRAISTVEKAVKAKAPIVIVLAANAATTVLPDLSGNPNSNPTVAAERYEIAGRYIQNVGANDVYYSFGSDANAVNNFHGKLSSGQQLNASTNSSSVSLFSVAGSTVAITVEVRNDLGRNNPYINP